MRLFSFLPLLAAVGAMAQTTNSKCGSSGVMCVSAVSQSNSTTQYTLTVKQSQVGWMAIGFGTQMINTPIVLMWRNPSSGQAVLSQRQTSRYAMPQVASNPDRVATALQYKTSFSSSQTSVSFEIPTSNGSASLIWAYSSNTPSTPSSPSSDIVQHDDMGTMQLPLGDSSSGDDDDEVPLTANQRMLVAHALFMTIGFLFVLPFGAIFVRLSRTWIPGRIWFGTHWIFQWPFAGALITIGFALAVNVVQKAGKEHFSTTHKKWGLTLVILYVIQCSLGGIIHFIKSKRRIRRPPQNYLHAFLGLFIISGSFWQVHNGYTVEWPRTQSLAVPGYINVLFIIWAILIPLLYVGGLTFLPRQYKQERDARAERVTELARRSPDSA
jgi:hypothetical protein